MQEAGTGLNGMGLREQSHQNAELGPSYLATLDRRNWQVPNDILVGVEDPEFLRCFYVV